MKTLFFLFLFAASLPLSVSAQLSTDPDTYPTELGELVIHPVNHGSIAFTLNGRTILVDPFGGAELFEPYGEPDLILITDIHGDHLHEETLAGLDLTDATFVVPQAVADQMESRGEDLRIIGNDESTHVFGIGIEAIPMYNLPGDESVRHVKGRGNGYVLDIGGTTLYISGDTEDIPEMRALQEIDIAFVCMNLPYTMDIQQAASAVAEFKPGIVYPYHHRGQDIEAFKSLVDEADVNVEVRLKDWYSN